jgi:hypothetical protein
MQTLKARIQETKVSYGYFAYIARDFFTRYAGINGNESEISQKM